MVKPKEVKSFPIWPRYPTLYEFNTWVWLSELSPKTGVAVDLGGSLEEWDALAKLGFDAVWLMGVWERSPMGIAIANQNTIWSTNSGEHFPILGRKIMSDLPIAYDATWLMHNSEAPKVSPVLGESLRSEA